MPLRAVCGFKWPGASRRYRPRRLFDRATPIEILPRLVASTILDGGAMFRQVGGHCLVVNLILLLRPETADTHLPTVDGEAGG